MKPDSRTPQPKLAPEATSTNAVWPANHAIRACYLRAGRVSHPTRTQQGSQGGLAYAPDRGKQHLYALLGEQFSGIVGSDRFAVYNSLDPTKWQVCWAHLRRDFTFHADLGLGPQEAFGEDGLSITWRLFKAWQQFQQDGDRALQTQIAPLKKELRRLLLWGSKGKRQRHTHGLAKNLLKLWPALWTFTTVPGDEPTNNAGERGLRAAVIYRKLSFGSQSEGGERTIERLLSVD